SNEEYKKAKIELNSSEVSETLKMLPNDIKNFSNIVDKNKGKVPLMIDEFKKLIIDINKCEEIKGRYCRKYEEIKNEYCIKYTEKAFKSLSGSTNENKNDQISVSNSDDLN